MKKIIFTLLLAIVSSGWAKGEELCSVSVPVHESQNFIRFNGNYTTLPYPCGEGEDCPDCMTLAFQTGEKTYYYADLTSTDIDYYKLDKIFHFQYITELCSPFTQGSYNYITRLTTNNYFPEGLTRKGIIFITGKIANTDLKQFPTCNDGDSCPPVLLLQLTTDNNIYYIGTRDSVIGAQLDRIKKTLPTDCEMPATLTGTLYAYGNYNYIAISSISALGDIQPKKKAPRLNSLCDKWYIAKISNAMGPQEEIHTVYAYLGTDTIIGTQKYVRLFEAGRYKGALREGGNSDIYYIPNGSAHEYLLYNFNANVGDTLSNLWYGGNAEQCPNGYNATVLSISEGTPRVFTVEVEYIHSDSKGDYISPWLVYWTEGVGLSDGPAGQICPGPDCACSCGQVVLCASINGEHIYTSDMGKKYGCEYNYDPYLTPDDTIPLYLVKDGPGTSTVDPADPNLIYAVLRTNMLIIRDFSGAEIYCTLVNTSKAADSPHHARRVRLQ